MREFLSNEGHYFTGANIYRDERLLRDFGVQLSNPQDLQLIVPTVHPKYAYLKKGDFNRSSLEEIAGRVLGVHLRKQYGFDHSRWGERALDFVQVQYAAKDAFLSFEIARQMEIQHGYNFFSPRAASNWQPHMPYMQLDDFILTVE